MSSFNQLVSDLQALADPARAAVLQRFFKTLPGEYGAGDVFLGITVPVQRRTALRYRDLPFKGIRRLLRSSIHEHRFCALEILVWQYEHGDAQTREAVFRFYLENTSGINNWDLVDNSAPYIVGAHLAGTRQSKLRRSTLVTLAASPNIWERRMAIVATLRLIRHGDTATTFKIARKLLADKHDLIHKATGWALREAGKVSEAGLLDFLERNYRELPRALLRYAIERFPPERRKRMLNGDFS